MPMSSNPVRSKPSWRVWRFDQIATNVNVRIDNPSKSGMEHYIGLEHLDPDSLRIRRWGSPDDVEATKLVFKKGDIIFGRRRAYQRKLGVAEFDGICSAHAMVLRAKPEVVLPEFLPLFMQSDLFMNRAVEISVGSLSPTINWTTMTVQEFALPPIDEQQRIVDSISSFDECIESYKALCADGRALIQSLLDRMWFAYPHRKIGSLVQDGLIAPPQDGNHGEKHPKASDYVTDGIPFVMASDLKHGFVDFAGCSKIPELLARSLRIGFAKAGDVLLSHKGTVGAVARLCNLPNDFAMLTPQVTYYRVTKPESLIPDWIYFAFQTPGFQRSLEQYGKQSTRAYVGITTQRELSIPFADIQQQRQFADELASLEATISGANSRERTLTGIRFQLLQSGVE
jgi:type I restriction enzyme S subunit